MRPETRALVLHLAVIAGLAALYPLLPTYHQGTLTRILVLAIYATGYNVLFGYTGLLSLGHAMFFGAGMYGLGLPMQHLDLPALPAFVLGIACAATLAAAVAALALRTAGVAFMIVTLMFSQAAFLTILYFTTWTRGEEGFVLAREARRIWGLDFSTPDVRFWTAFALFAAALLLTLWMARSRFGHVLVAIRENEERTRMLGYDVQSHKFRAVVISGAFAGASGAAYGLFFGYVGATFASVQYSIFPLLWVLLGGAGTILGPLVGTAFMFYLVNWSQDLTSAYMLVAGVVLVLLTLFARGGIVGEIRKRWLRWLP